MLQHIRKIIQEDNIIVTKTRKSSRKRLEDLTLKDNFLFTAVMSNPDNCKNLLELVLKIEIDKVEVNAEKSIINHPEYRSVRLDVYAKDEDNTRYNIEMQVAPKHLEKRSRYYHSQMDYDILRTGVPYEELPNSYVIFICDFDPFGKGLYQYKVRKFFRENPEREFDDGNYTIFLSTKGKNTENVPEKLVEFLDFLGKDLDGQNQFYEDSYIRQLQKSITEIKRDRVWSTQYMLLGELIDEEKRIAKAEGIEEGKAEGIKTACVAFRSTLFSMLSKFGSISDSLKNEIDKINDLDRISELMILAGKVASLEEFESKM